MEMRVEFRKVIRLDFIPSFKQPDNEDKDDGEGDDVIKLLSIINMFILIAVVVITIVILAIIHGGPQEWLV